MYNQTEFTRDSWEVRKAQQVWDRWIGTGSDRVEFTRLVSEATGWHNEPLNRLVNFMFHIHS